MRTLFKTCPRKVYFRYVAGIQVKDQATKARIIGTLFHKGLESLRKGEYIYDVLSALREDLTVSNLGALTQQVEMIKLTAYLVGYKSHFSQDWDHLDKLKTEFKIVRDDEVCIIDALLENEDDTVDVIEDKTTSQFQGCLAESLVLNEQLLNYWEILRSIDVDVKTFRYRETLKSLHRPIKNEDHDSFRFRLEKLYVMEKDRYREFEVQLLERELYSYISDKREIDFRIDDMVDQYKDREYFEWPKNSAACLGKWGACDYLTLCANKCAFINTEYETNGKDPIDNNAFINRYGVHTDLLQITDEKSIDN
jgi:CRISPR/Cas system-associated exonuclease Cas4 (RecB family)